MVHARRWVSAFIVILAFATNLAAGQPSGAPIYIRIDNGWKGLYGVEDEYAEYSFKGAETKLQDPYHILLKPAVGMMVTFADKRGLTSNNDPIDAYLQQELQYWRQRSSNVESSPRGDLSGARNDVRVTEIRLYN